MSSVTAILVSYNSKDVIATALRALVDEPLVANIMVVDNASSDGTAAMIAHEFPRVKLLQNECNEGFGRANNRALMQVETPYALLINPDAVLEKDALAALIVAAEHYADAAILAPQLMDEEGHIILSYKRGVFAREKSAGQGLLPEGDICAEYLSGAVWLVNVTHMQNVGFFDQAIFLYYEDDDLCLRTRAAGFSNVQVAAARAVHLQGASSGAPNSAGEYFKQKHMVSSRLYLQQKYHGAPSAKRLALRLGVEYALKAALYALICNPHKLARYKGRVAGCSIIFPNKNPHVTD